jgi:hypothetical protein
VNFLELASLKRRSEAIDPATVDVAIALVPRTTNLVEVSKGKPTCPLSRFVCDELGEEIVFPVRSRRPIDPRYLEIAIIARVDNMNIGREAKLCDGHIRHLHDRIVPKKKNAATCSSGWPLGEAFEMITLDAARVGAGN